MSEKVVEIVTRKIIEALEKGVAPWKQCWSSQRPRNLISGRPYSGCNAFLTHPMITGFKEPGFLTRNQIKKLGAEIKEEHKKNATPIIFYKQAKKKDSEELSESLHDFLGVPRQQEKVMKDITPEILKLPKKYRGGLVGINELTRGL